MAKKISEMSAIVTPADDDYLPIVDISEADDADKNKRITISVLSSYLGGAEDAGDVTYTPAVDADWDGDTDPGNVDGALDQLAERVDDNETSVATKADDSGVVHNTGDETIADIKTFSSFPITPSSAPVADYQTANKKYVDDNSGGDLVTWGDSEVDFGDSSDAASASNAYQYSRVWVEARKFLYIEEITLYARNSGNYTLDIGEGPALGGDEYWSGALEAGATRVTLNEPITLNPGNAYLFEWFRDGSAQLSNLENTYSDGYIRMTNQYGLGNSPGADDTSGHYRPLFLFHAIDGNFTTVNLPT